MFIINIISAIIQIIAKEDYYAMTVAMLLDTGIVITKNLKRGSNTDIELTSGYTVFMTNSYYLGSIKFLKWDQ